jgi:hypothetical protein
MRVGDFEEAIAAKSEAYTEFYIPKKHGERQINAIRHAHKLYDIQCRLLDKILSNVGLSPAAKGFVKGESYQSYLHEHLGHKYYLRLDLDHFFESITSDMVNEIFHFLWDSFGSDEQEQESVIGDIGDICTLNGSLPQGAVTSPTLSNIVFLRADQRIMKYCQKLGVHYTRYADDLLFSGNALNFDEKQWFFKKIEFILRERDFNINFSKTRYAQNEISLNGFVIGATLRLSRKRISEIVSVLRFCEQNESFLRKQRGHIFVEKINAEKLPFRIRPFTSMNQIVQYLLGHRAFLMAWHTAENETRRVGSLIRRIEKIVDSINETLYPIS